MQKAESTRIVQDFRRAYDRVCDAGALLAYVQATHQFTQEEIDAKMKELHEARAELEDAWKQLTSP